MASCIYLLCGWCVFLINVRYLYAEWRVMCLLIKGDWMQKRFVIRNIVGFLTEKCERKERVRCMEKAHL